MFCLIDFQAWNGAPGAPFFDLGSVFAMNGLSPQATFKPSPNPRYPGSMGGRGRGGRRGGGGNVPQHSSNHGEPAQQQQQQTGAVTSNGPSNPPSKSSSEPAQAASANAGAPSAAGRDSSKESGPSGTSHHPAHAKQVADGHSGASSGYGAAPGEERRFYHDNERSDRQPYGYGRGRGRGRGTSFLLIFVSWTSCSCAYSLNR